MGFFSNLFGSGWQKMEDKGDEFRLDLLYKEAAYFYKKALDELGDPNHEATPRLTNKLQEVSRKGVDDLLEEAKELLGDGDAVLARERLESAASLTDNPERIREVEAQLQAFEASQASGPVEKDVERPHEVASTEEDIYELSLDGFESQDRERAVRGGDVFRKAFEACQNENWDEGLRHLGHLLEEHPSDPLYLEMAALCFERKGHQEEALQAYRQSNELEGGRPGTIHGLVDTLRHLDQGEDAARILAESIQHRPEPGTLTEHWIELSIDHALTTAEQGQAESGLALLKELLAEPNAKAGGLYFNMAGIYEQSGREEEARAALEKAIAASPRNPLYKERFSDFLVHRGLELQGALDLLIEANEVETTSPGGIFGGGGFKATVSPNRGRYLYKMARIYYLKGNDLEAEKTVTTAVALTRDPDVLQALEALKDEIKQART